jgi:hypothetical protein
MRILKVLLYDVFIVGVLYLGYNTGHMQLAGNIVGIFYGFVFFFGTIGLASFFTKNKENKEKIDLILKNNTQVQLDYNYVTANILSVLLMITTYYMGYYKIVIIMFTILLIGFSAMIKFIELQKEKIDEGN